ncbi:hypothetical protein GTP46_27620 [Duganella sp. FT135W]|uniref:Uncharacterized protein n=1 Tax=Duganella flavida TaxID=2692175 RepID=A0A6L8KG29_9BURK|nr:hypothetical protein [Duganella flavida]MYM26403.1 hypothetical protein [Duganella flavida]
MWDPAFVTSTSPTAAIREYLRQVYSKDAVFREHVQDLRSSDAFVCGLVYNTVDEITALFNGHRNEAPEQVHKRVQDFFSDCPEHGDVFWKYVETEDVSLISEAIYEYIAERNTDGIVAIEASKIPTLMQRDTTQFC